MTERTASVVYTANTPLPDGQRDAFELSFQVPDAEGEVLAFPTIQTCEKGETAWTQIPAEGQAEDDLESPAPSFTILAASGEGHHGDEAARATRSRRRGLPSRRPTRRLTLSRRRRDRVGRGFLGPRHCRPRSRPARPGRRRTGPGPDALDHVTPRARPGWWRRAVRHGLALATASLVALAIVLVGVSPASAHAELVSTDPEEGAVLETAPSKVTLTFNEPVRLTSQEVAVYDAEGDPVDASAAANGPDVTVTLPARGPRRRDLRRVVERPLRRRPPDLGGPDLLRRRTQRLACRRLRSPRPPRRSSRSCATSSRPSPSSDC